MMLSAFCIHVSSGSGLICLSSHWSTHSSQDQVQSTIKLALLQKAKKPWESQDHQAVQPAGCLGPQGRKYGLNVPLIITCLSFFHIPYSKKSHYGPFFSTGWFCVRWDQKLFVTQCKICYRWGATWALQHINNPCIRKRGLQLFLRVILQRTKLLILWIHD